MGYLRETGKLTPEVSMRLENAISMGYQRLLTFEVAGGGFDWFGHAPANVALTAYGIMEFHDMARVHTVDHKVIDRAATWLRTQQKQDGSWREPRLPHTLSVGKGDLALTAFVVWSLAESGMKDDCTRRGVEYLLRNADKAADPYTLALLSNALAAWDPKGEARSAVGRLQPMGTKQGDGLVWQRTGQTLTYGSGTAGDVETTALACLSFFDGGGKIDSINGALSYLVGAKDANGGWHSTQATILAMMALLRQATPSNSGDARVVVKVNGAEAGVLTVTPDQSDVMQLLDLRPHVTEGENRVELEVEGGAAMTYQVVGRYFLPWDQVRREEGKAPLDIALSYDRTTLEKDDTLNATVRVNYNDENPTFMVIVDLGIPPGFAVDPTAFNEAVAKKQIEKYSIGGRQVTLYLGNIAKGAPFQLQYALKAKYPIRAKTPKSTVYEYYNPDRRAEAAPIEILVK